MKDPLEFLKHYRNKLSKLKNWKQPVSQKFIENLHNGALKIQKVTSNSDAIIKKESLNLFFNWMKIILDAQNKINIDDESQNLLFENLVLSISKKLSLILYENCSIPFWHYHLVDMWNTLLKSCSSEGLKNQILLKPKILYNLLCLVHFIGHYGTQKILLTILIKMLNTLDYNTKYNLMKMVIQSEDFIKKLLLFNLHDFDNQARTILNDFNLKVCKDCTVYSIEVESIVFGEYVVNNFNNGKDNKNKNDKNWINFNSTPKSISFSCSSTTFGLTFNKWISFELLLSEAHVKDNKLMVKSKNEPVLIPHYDEFPITIWDIRRIEFVLSKKVADDLGSKEDLFKYINGSLAHQVISDKNNENTVSENHFNLLCSSRKQQSEFRVLQKSDSSNPSANVAKCNKLPDLFENSENEKICSKILLSLPDKLISNNNQAIDNSNLNQNFMTEFNQTNAVCESKRDDKNDNNNQDRKLLGRSCKSQQNKSSIISISTPSKSITQPMPITSSEYINFTNQIIERSDNIPVRKTPNVTKRRLYVEKLPNCEGNRIKNKQKARLINLVRPLILLDNNKEDTDTIIDTTMDESKICDENILNGVIKEISENGGYLKIKQLLKNPQTLSQFTQSQIQLIETNLKQINKMTENSANKLNLNLNDSLNNSFDIYDIRNISSTKADEIHKNFHSNRKRKANEPKKDNNNVKNKRFCRLNKKISFSYRSQKYLESMETKQKETIKLPTVSKNNTNSPKKFKLPVQRKKRQTSTKLLDNSLCENRRKPDRCNNIVERKQQILSNIQGTSNRIITRTQSLQNTVNKNSSKINNKNIKSKKNNASDTNKEIHLFDQLKAQPILRNRMPSHHYKDSSIYSDSNNNYEINNSVHSVLEEPSVLSDIIVRMAEPIKSTPIKLNEPDLNKTKTPDLHSAINFKNAAYLEEEVISVTSEGGKNGNKQMEIFENNMLDSKTKKHLNTNNDAIHSTSPIQIVASYQSEKTNSPFEKSLVDCKEQAELNLEELNAINCSNDTEKDWIFDRYFNSLSTGNIQEAPLECNEITTNSDFSNLFNSDDCLIESNNNLGGSQNKNLKNFLPVSQIISHTKTNTRIDENQILIQQCDRPSYQSNFPTSNVIHSGDIILRKRKSSCITDYQIIARKSPRIESTSTLNDIIPNNNQSLFYNNLLETFIKASGMEIDKITNNFINVCNEKVKKTKVMQLSNTQLERLEQCQNELIVNLDNFTQQHVIFQKVAKDLQGSIDNMKTVQREGEQVLKSLHENIRGDDVIESEYLKASTSIENRLGSIRTDLWKRHVDSFIDKMIKKFKSFYDLD